MIRRNDSKGSRSRIKRKFHGNRYTRKDHYVILDTRIFNEIAKLVVCKRCGGTIKLSTNNFQGLSFNLKVTCEQCQEIGDIKSSDNIAGSNHKDINVRFNLAMRMLGHGLTGLKTMCGILNLPRPVTQKPHDSYDEMVMKASEKVAKESMLEAAEEEATLSQSNDVAVSGDGTWRRAGFSSLQGVATLIGVKTGKVIDTETKNTICRKCDHHKRKLNAPDLANWLIKHLEEQECTANHRGNSGKMEVDGMVAMFRRSEELYQIRYSHYVGDGDTKSFKNIVESRPYGDFVIKKKECVGHVQKRMGSRLRNLKKMNTGIGDRGQLTDKYIDTLAAYFGKAIRENCQSVDDMHRSIWAIFYHESSTDAQPNHQLCPVGENSWCKYNSAMSKNQLSTYKHKKTLPVAIWSLMKSVFDALTEPSLLERCLGGYNQNKNESLNAKIWKIAPKKTYSGYETVRIAVALATISFNGGMNAIKDVFEELGLKTGEYTLETLNAMDNLREKKKHKQDSRRNSNRPEIPENEEKDSDWEDEEYYGPGIDENLPKC